MSIMMKIGRYRMTKNTMLRTLAACIAAAIALIACGGHESENSPGGEEPQIGVTLLAGECSEYVGGTSISQRLSSLAVQFYDASGKIVQIKGKNAASFTKDDLLRGTLKITDIPPMSGARVVFSGFEEGDSSAPKWRGEARDLTFVKGQTTAVTTVLYPLDHKGCFPAPLGKPRFGHAAAQLPDGRIVVTGGFVERSNTVWEATRDVELLDPETGTVDRIADMSNPRAFHHLTVLPDGRLLIAGGVRRLEPVPTTVGEYPDLPVTLSIPMNGVELYTIDFPKANLRTAATTDKSASTFILSDLDPFMLYQSYAYVMSDPQTGSGTLFMIGGVREGAAQSKIYGVEVAVNGAEATATLNEYHSDKSDTYVWPLLAPAGVDEFGNPRVLVVGGRKGSAGSFAALVTKSAYSDWPHSAPNLFFPARSLHTTEGSVIATGGLVIDGANFAMNGDAYLFTPSLAVQKKGPLYWGRWLGAVALSEKDGYLLSFGGFDTFKENTEAKIPGTTFYEYAPLDTLSFDPYQKWGDGAVPRGGHTIVSVAGDPGMFYVIGGIKDLKGSESDLVGLIEMLPMLNPF